METTTRVPPRSEIPTEYTWDLTTVYADDAAWEAAVQALDAQLPAAERLQGSIRQGAEALLQALEFRDRLFRAMERLHVYASLRKDSDSADSAGQALTERAGSLLARLRAVFAFLEPEILSLPDETLRTWRADEQRLSVYGHALDEVMRKRPHVRSAEVENVVAQLSDVTRAPGEIFNILTNADLTFPSILDENNQPTGLSQGRYLRFMESSVRRVRQETFQGMHGAFRSVRNTIGTTLAAAVRNHVVQARIHRYASALEASLHPNDVPVDVYHNLLATVEDNLPRLHRYMRLRRRLLGLDELHYYDLYAPLVAEVDLTIPYAEATHTIRAALEPLGADYVDVLDQAFRGRWIDVYENVGKRSGAYSGGAYETAPFILLNYQNTLNDMFTLAHELGHTGHSYFTRHAQPFVYGDYTIFVAEVASTLNETLLTDHLLRTRDDAPLRKHLIVQQMEDIRTTIIRQTMFANFELAIHQMTEAGQPLTAENLSQRYFDVVRLYYAAELELDDDVAIEWARIPHFYYNFYVYQYATGLSAALALSKQILSEGRPAVERYLRFLSSGSSQSPIDLLREAGVDMTTPEPIQQALDTFDQLLTQLEAMA